MCLADAPHYNGSREKGGEELTMGVRRTRLQIQFGSNGSVLKVGFELESALLADAAHLAIFGKDGRHHSVNTLLLCNLDQMTVQRCTKPLMLPVVIHQHGKLGFVASAQLTEPTNADDFGLTSFVSVFGHQRYLSVVIDETDSGQPFVRRSLA